MYEVMTIHLSAHNERLKQELSVLTSKLNEGFDILIQYPSEESGGDHVVWIYLYKPLPKHFPASLGKQVVISPQKPLEANGN